MPKYKSATYANNGAECQKFTFFDSGDNGEHNSVVLLEISKTFARPGKCFQVEERYMMEHSI